MLASSEYAPRESVHRIRWVFALTFLLQTDNYKNASSNLFIWAEHLAGQYFLWHHTCNSRWRFVVPLAQGQVQWIRMSPNCQGPIEMHARRVHARGPTREMFSGRGDTQLVVFHDLGQCQKHYESEVFQTYLGSFQEGAWVFLHFSVVVRGLLDEFRCPNKCWTMYSLTVTQNLGF